MTWTQTSAIAEVSNLASSIDKLQRVRRFSADHTRWVLRTRTFLEEVFGLNSTYYQTFVALPWEANRTMIVDALDAEREIEEGNQEAYRNQLDTAKGLLQAASDRLTRGDFDKVYQGKDTKPESSQIIKVLNLADSLRKAIHIKPAKEKEVQDAFETLLIGADVEFSREKEHLEYSSKTYVPDFTFTRLGLIVEIKLCGRDGREAEIIAEINDDILAYKTKYGNLIFVVYDLGFIRDTDAFRGSLVEHQQVEVRVVKH
jgi:hypothetical protein